VGSEVELVIGPLPSGGPGLAGLILGTVLAPKATVVSLRPSAADPNVALMTVEVPANQALGLAEAAAAGQVVAVGLG
jgi:hypothetical protein